MLFEHLLASAGAWAWSSFGKDIVSNIAKGAGKTTKKGSEKIWKRFNWNHASNQYHKKIIDLYSEIRVLGKAQPVPIDGIFTDVYVLDQPTAYRRYDINQLREDPLQLERDCKRINGLNLIKQARNNRLFILGKPGAGKTTFLKYITLQAAQGKLDRVPVFISLKEWVDWIEWSSPSKVIQLKPFLIKQFDICNFPDAESFIDYLLENGRAILLFDGLDEVPLEKDQRAGVISELRDFSKKYDTCLCLVTCRIAATDYSFDRFTYVEIADFNEEQIETFVRKWFHNDDRKLEMFGREFGKVEHRGLHELANSPLLLTLLCLTFESTLTFPHRRAEIYEEAIEALIKKWDASRGIKRDDIYRNLSLGRKRQMLAHIAAETFNRNEYFMRQNDLIAIIDSYIRNLPSSDVEGIGGEAILKAVEAQHGILVERAHRIYSFSHLTFQEFFTAKYIVETPASLPLEDLLRREHLTDSRWREVLLLASSMFSTAEGFFRLFKQNCDRIIANEPTLVELIRWVQLKADDIHSTNNKPEIRAIYCHFALLQHRIRGLDINLVVMPELAPIIRVVGSRIIDMDIDNTRLRARMLAQALAPRLINDISANLECDILLEIMLSLVITFSQFIEYEKIMPLIGNYRLFVATVRDKCLDLGLYKLAKQITKRAFLDTNCPQIEWTYLVPKLQGVLQAYRKIGFDWELTETQNRLLLEYFVATDLFVECLELAFVSNRASMKNSLLTLNSIES